MLRYTTLTLSGVAGAQDTGQPYFGYLNYIRVAYTNGNALGTLVVTDKATGLTLLDTSAATAVEGPVRQDAIDADGAAISGVAAPIPVIGYITATWAAHNSNTEITLELWIDE